MPAFYRATLATFIADDPKRIVGELATKSGDSGFVDLKNRQIKAWEVEINVLTSTCKTLIAEIPESPTWTLLLEYPIIRRQKRIDAVVLAAGVIFCLEFKTKDKAHSKHSQRQVEDYALDLRDFHQQSFGRHIFPIAVAVKAPPAGAPVAGPGSGLVHPVQLANATDLGTVLLKILGTAHENADRAIDPSAWDNSDYRPVPTIIEAAEILYGGHNVREIDHFHADNLNATSDKIIEIIREAQRGQKKVICFVTGVPGAGKTLAGLNVVHNPVLREMGRPPGVFLSGNGPLVKIVSAAIVRDFKRRKRSTTGEREVSTFVQNVHTFVRAALDNPSTPPAENVIVFDEAQRAWDAKQTERKTDQEGSEPEILLSIMDRHAWAVIVALVGGGQEINVGEAGLSEWGRALRSGFSHWHIVASPKAVTGDASLAGQSLFDKGDDRISSVQREPSLHLDVSLRSFRVQRLTEWVEAVLRADSDTAAKLTADLGEFPLRLTRSLPIAKTWLWEQARGLRRCGLVASSGAVRLRADGLELSSGFRQGNRDLYVHWFLDDPTDVRSSNRLEIAASEFECQGLELDWIGVCWGGDFTFDPLKANWTYRSFSGSRWGDVHNEIDRRYLLNTYRVLLTRAREGLIIWVPQGDSSDETRPPELFDATATYLKKCGLTEV